MSKNVSAKYYQEIYYLSEDEKQKLAVYRKKYCRIKKTLDNSLSFLNKNVLAFIFRYYFAKESLKIRKIISKNSNFI